MTRAHHLLAIARAQDAGFVHFAEALRVLYAQAYPEPVAPEGEDLAYLEHEENPYWHGNLGKLAGEPLPVIPPKGTALNPNTP